MPDKSAPNTPKKSSRSLLSFFTPPPYSLEDLKVPQKESPELPKTAELSCSTETLRPSSEEGLIGMVAVLSCGSCRFLVTEIT
ncbi:hypothetical protein K493DRAFT_65829 [Basidiobolus meristosporus CBS 931.73]|uniref:Uncharacterized protein n=1 Tax=Basidiobolus meristosporus CBS 931.73 TaxID=1314790 RepID=A0A1Y1XVP5_9FUNG|nr:hypothetical protein K493DRAFT_65829 [Basidiobolus meristosporus CBS 931.73]|eukprot:ORX89745.1 hypothetical protein K493DRAFT_65829 [Basidiobolus meristosporus CBS 931.73]